jgi:hypothetical protein
LNGKPFASADTPVAAGFWHTTRQTVSGKPAPGHFTRDELNWEPWLEAKPLEAFNDDEQAILAKFGHTDSPYFRLLARNQPVLEQRTLTDKGIFYTPGGLPRERSWPPRSPVRLTAVFIAHRCMPARRRSWQKMRVR